MNTTEQLIQAYRAFSPNSAALSGRAQTVFPGGDTRSSAHYEPYPLAIDHADGPQLTDIDGNVIIDFMNNFTSLIHGHAHADVVAAVQSQVARGSAYAAPNDAQVALAELIVSRVKSVEQMRFTSSGTEGTLMAIRAARAATGRQKIMKMEGGYHGSYELAEVSLVPLPKNRGSAQAPASNPVDASFPESVLRDTLICPFNDADSAARLIDEQATELAAVIVEPVLGSMGMIAAQREFLQTLRERTTRHGIVLIFDEVITYRLHQSGAQGIYGIEPDLTCFGKIIGGGLPIGAVGGKESIMQLFSPKQPRPVMHASTFSGNALTMAAGLAAMQAYSEREIQHINTLAEQLRDGFNQTFAQNGVKGQAVGIGSLSNIHFSDGAMNNARDNIDTVIEAGQLPSLLHLGMLRRGIMSASRLMYCTSTVMKTDHIEHAITALNETLIELRPWMDVHTPSLLIH